MAFHVWYWVHNQVPFFIFIFNLNTYKNSSINSKRFIWLHIAWKRKKCTKEYIWWVNTSMLQKNVTQYRILECMNSSWQYSQLNERNLLWRESDVGWQWNPIYQFSNLWRRSVSVKEWIAKLYEWRVNRKIAVARMIRYVNQYPLLIYRRH